MKYQKIKDDKTGVSYCVTEHGTRTAEFSYYMERKLNDIGNTEGRFWLDEVKLFGEFANYECMYAVLQFISYKCWCAGITAVYLKISGKNLFYMELYKKFGFYVIAEEKREIRKGIMSYEYVMKYPLPMTREEEYFHYIRGK